MIEVRIIHAVPLSNSRAHVRSSALSGVWNVKDPTASSQASVALIGSILRERPITQYASSSKVKPCMG